MGKKYLIGQLACFGDCLYATTIAKQLRQDEPDCHITWAVAEKYKSILSLNPHVDEVWSIGIENNDFYWRNWDIFKKEAEQKKANGIFDEIFYTQVFPDNFKNFNGLIRLSILKAFPRKITVPVQPVVVLSQTEINKVAAFAQQHKLSSYQHVILFECSPGSGQSYVDTEYALQLSRKLVEKNADLCVILTTYLPLKTGSERIIVANEISYRENAELTHYCTLLVGTSSGITWLSTSTAAKKLPMLQLLTKHTEIYASVVHDFEIWDLDVSEIIELYDCPAQKAEKVINDILEKGIKEVRNIYHEKSAPTKENLQKLISTFVNYSIKDLLSMKKAYISQTPSIDFSDTEAIKIIFSRYFDLGKKKIKKLLSKH